MRAIIFITTFLITQSLKISEVSKWSDLILQNQNDQRNLELLNIDTEYMDAQDLKETYYEIVPNIQNTCQILKKIGGHWKKSCGFWDGEKLICMEKIFPFIKNDSCLVYSFGLADDWDFEILMAELGKFISRNEQLVIWILTNFSVNNMNSSSLNKIIKKKK